MQTEPTATTRLLDLSAAECWDLAATRPVGRLAWAGAPGPTVIPVNFSVDGTTVRVRTSGYSAVARECDDVLVAFEVDSFDEDARSGWSVLMRGRAHLEYGDPAGGTDPDVWLTGPRTLRLRIEVGEVTGRRVQSQR